MKESVKKTKLTGPPARKDLAAAAEVPRADPLDAGARVDPRRETGLAEVERFIGPYRILGTLGTGGMSVVYRAEDPQSNRPVAVKTVHIPAPKYLASLRREIHALTRIRHPGVVRIVAQGVQVGRPWYAMELLEGSTFREYIDRIWGNESSSEIATAERAPNDDSRPVSEAAPRLSHTATFSSETLPWPEAQPRRSARAAGGALAPTLELLWRVCSTIAYLHGEGIINCDLKPENVVVLPDRGPIIIDFGLTSRFGGANGREILDSARGISGTVFYMSPEQIRNEFVDARADLYAIGCIMYECVTGRPPFVGSNAEVLLQHLSAEPVPPSELVTEVPRELDLLILNLLQKRLQDRIGYAADVSSALRELIGDDTETRATTYPAARPYLYRPQFSGRRDLLQQVLARIPTHSSQAGVLVLVGGESGVGKTRFAMEITRLARRPGLRITTAECIPPASSSSGAMGRGPLHALRPLLQLISDRCQEAGREFTDRVLGPRGPVLALYEPSLAHAPGQDAQPTPLKLASSAAHRQLFNALADTLMAFAARERLLVVIDDVQWADELTLAFLRFLTPAHFAAPFVILGTYRTEEPVVLPPESPESVHLLKVVLAKMGDDSVRSIVQDMLALSTPPPETLVRFLTQRSGGNPFFVAEYLRAAVEAQLIQRRTLESWRVRQGEAVSSAAAYESLPIPQSLQDLISQRLKTFSPLARAVADMAAVFGSDVDAAVLLDAVALGDDDGPRALDEVVTRQILETTAAGTFRFAHDKLREVVYAEIAPDQARELHRRAALAIEGAYEDTEDFGRFWSALGHHFATAGLPGRAAEYLIRAGDHARAGHANDEALANYRRAIAEVDRLLLESVDEQVSWRPIHCQLHEKVGDLLALSGQGDQSRQSYDTAVRRLAAEDSLARARVHRKIGTTFDNQHRHDESLRSYALAEQMLGPEPGQAPEGWRAEWLQLRAQEFLANYWLARLPALEELVAKIQTNIAFATTARERSYLAQARMLLCFRKERYSISEEGVEYARAVLNGVLSSGNLVELPFARFAFAFSLFLNGQLEAAEWELRSALSAAERAGDVGQKARCFTYLTVVARRRSRIDDVRSRVSASQAVAQAAGMRDYIGAAYGNQAWLALRESDHIGAEGHAARAVDIWGSLTYTFPFQWTALFPLLAVRLMQEDLLGAISCATALLEPIQQRLAGEVEAILREGIERFETSGSSAALETLSGALSVFRRYGYL
jgi:serine/threonine protein kinase